MMQLTSCHCNTGRCRDLGLRLPFPAVARRRQQLHKRRHCCEQAEDCMRCSAHQECRSHSGDHKDTLSVALHLQASSLAHKVRFAAGPQPTEHSFKEDLLPPWPGGVPPEEFDAVYAKISDEKVWSNPFACAKCAAGRPSSALDHGFVTCAGSSVLHRR